MPRGHSGVEAARRRTGAWPPVGPGVQRSAVESRSPWRSQELPGDPSRPAPRRSHSLFPPAVRGFPLSPHSFAFALAAGPVWMRCVLRFNSGAG